MSDTTYEIRVRIHVDRALTDHELRVIGDEANDFEQELAEVIQDAADDLRVFSVEAHGPEAVA